MDAAGGEVESISAVTLVTRDMAAAVAFYDALGFRSLYGGARAGFTSYRVGNGFLNLQLDPAWSAPSTVWGRIVFHVTDVDGLHRQAVAAGLRPEAAPADAAWGERYFHLRDPDGHELSFARPLAGDPVEGDAT
jgi:catechol 2,3-dioxygenase-like lactoylglutathione lyase family enzyme